MAVFGQPQQQSFFQQAAAPQAPQDFKIPAPGPTDGITSISFSRNNLLAVGSWDSSVYIWQVHKSINNIQVTPKAMQKYDAPVLDIAFKPEGDLLFAGCTDNTLRMYNTASNQSVILGRHDQPIKCVHWLPVHDMVVTGSWDASVRFWTINNPGQREAYKLELKMKVYAMDVNFPMMVVSTAETQVFNQNGQQQPQEHPVLHVYDITMQQGQPTLIHPPLDSTLKHQTRCVAIFNNKQMNGAVVNNNRFGFAVGSVEGRVVIKDMDELHGKRSFAFKCHRPKAKDHQGKPSNTTYIYPVNAISFNPRGTFATAGSDGVFNFWDKEGKTRLKEFKVGEECRQGQTIPQIPMHQTLQNDFEPYIRHSISTATFNSTGDMFAYAMSYDWCLGDHPEAKKLPNDIYIHAVQEAEVTPQAKKR
jgi:mRNA export factor